MAAQYGHGILFGRDARSPLRAHQDCRASTLRPEKAREKEDSLVRSLAGGQRPALGATWPPRPRHGADARQSPLRPRAARILEARDRRRDRQVAPRPAAADRPGVGRRDDRPGDHLATRCRRCSASPPSAPSPRCGATCTSTSRGCRCASSTPRSPACSISRVMTDAEGIRNLVGTGLVQLVGSVVTAVLALGVLFYLNWHLTLVTISVLAAFGGVMSYAFRRLRPLFRERGKINAEVTGRLGAGPRRHPRRQGLHGGEARADRLREGRPPAAAQHRGVDDRRLGHDRHVHGHHRHHRRRDDRRRRARHRRAGR